MSPKSPPAMMRAFGARAYSSPDKWETLTKPKPSITSPNDVLIQVHAADLSLVDTKMTSGAARFVVHVPMPHVVGCNFSGVVSEVGTEVSKFRAGDRVYGLMLKFDQGAVSEYVTLSADEITLKPEGITHVEAVSFPGSLLTAYQCLLRAEAMMKSKDPLSSGIRGKVVFVPGALGSTGSMGVQLAKHVFGAKSVISTVSTTKVAMLPKIVGENTVDRIIDYTTENPLKAIEKGSVDLLFDTLGQWTSLTSLVNPQTGVVISIAGVPTSKEMRSDHLPKLPFFVYWILNAVNWYYVWLLRGKAIQYDWVFGRNWAGELELVDDWIKGEKLRPVVGKVVDFADEGAMKEAAIQVGTMKGTIGRTVIRIVPEVS